MANLKEYFEHARALMDVPGMLYRDRFTVAGNCVELTTPSAELRMKFLPALQHLPAAVAQNPDLRIFYTDTQSSGKRLSAPPWPDFNPQGFHPGLEQQEFSIFYQPWHRQVYLYSHAEQLAIYWVDHVDEVPWWETSFSFRIIFHWWTRDRPLQLVHAGAMAATTEGGWVITGPSGSGKSTTCMRLLQHGAYYLGDDYIMVSTDDRPRIYMIYQTAKLEADNLDENFVSFHKSISNAGTYRKEKAILHIKNNFPSNCLPETPLKGILLPRISHTPNSNMDPVSATRAMIGIAPTTLHHLPHHRETSYGKIRELASRVPVLTWNIGSDPSHLIKSFYELN